MTAARPVRLALRTRTPDKWLAVDTETGDVWQGTPAGGWARPSLHALVKATGQVTAALADAHDRDKLARAGHA